MVTIKITNFGAKLMDFSILEILDNFWRGNKNWAVGGLCSLLLRGVGGLTKGRWCGRVGIDDVGRVQK